MTHILTLCQRSPHSSRLSLNFTPKMSESTWDQRGPHFSSWRFSPLPPPQPSLEAAGAGRLWTETPLLASLAPGCKQARVFCPYHLHLGTL